MATPLPILDDPGAASAVAPETDAVTAEAREAALIAWLRGHTPLAIGFSGGVDSAYLAVVARRALGREGVLAVIGRSASFPQAQWSLAREVAAAHDLDVLELATDELEDPAYAANPTDRCYHCKRVLWHHVVPAAAARGIGTVADGTNADDLHDHRPGGRAAAERGVLSPLAALGFTKAEIRLRSRALGLVTWAQPSAPCLASRLPYGTAVTIERLAQVERAEAALRALGVEGDLRVRHHGDLARLELGAAAATRWLTPESWPALVSATRAGGYARVAVDLDGFRSGSLNVLGGVRPAGPPAAEPGNAADAWADALPAPAVAGRLALWRLSDADRDAVLASASRRRALAARARGTGATHAALELTSS
ncbi:MAG: ATP-dependent sacrificial sulfur transferase LarE [Gemmatimonadota bacterium]